MNMVVLMILAIRSKEFPVGGNSWITPPFPNGVGDGMSSVGDGAPVGEGVGVYIGVGIRVGVGEAVGLTVAEGVADWATCVP